MDSARRSQIRVSLWDVPSHLFGRGGKLCRIWRSLSLHRRWRGKRLGQFAEVSQYYMCCRIWSKYSDIRYTILLYNIIIGNTYLLFLVTQTLQRRHPADQPATLWRRLVLDVPRERAGVHQLRERRTGRRWSDVRWPRRQNVQVAESQVHRSAVLRLQTKWESVCYFCSFFRAPYTCNSTYTAGFTWPIKRPNELNLNRFRHHVWQVDTSTNNEMKIDRVKTASTFMKFNGTSSYVFVRHNEHNYCLNGLQGWTVVRRVRVPRTRSAASSTTTTTNASVITVRQVSASHLLR